MSQRETYAHGAWGVPELILHCECNLSVDGVAEGASPLLLPMTADLLKSLNERSREADVGSADTYTARSEHELGWAHAFVQDSTQSNGR